MGRFGNFVGRNREMDRLMELSAKDGVFTELPPNLVEFVKQNYDPFVPYHNPVHVLSGLLVPPSPKGTTRRQGRLDRTRCRTQRLGSRIAGGGVSTTDLRMAEGNLEWLAATKINPQDSTESINDTRFPYGWPRRSEVSGWVRLADTLRIASGDHAQFLDGDGTPFHAYFYESTRFCDELHAAKKLPEWNARGDVLTWLEKGQVGFFFGTLKNDVVAGDRFSGVTWNIVQQLHENQERLRALLASEAGRERLLSGYDFLGNDVTFPEFVAHCRSIDL